MANEKDGSVQAGSPITGGPNMGQPQAEMVPKAVYDELYTKMGEMGNENGEYRKFFGDITPLLEKLDENPEIAQAILDEKFDTTLAEAIIAGKVSIIDAAVVQTAHTEVKKELGNKAYNAASSEDIATIVDQKVKERMQSFSEDQRQRDELRSFEQHTNEFIANTPDFTDFSDQITKWLDNHADVTDVETAYYAVKGKLSEGEAANRTAQAQGDAAKDVALNAAGGAGNATYIRKDEKLVDVLIGGRSNPNVF